MLMEFASSAAKRSTCLRQQVGAVIAIDGRPLSIGYAGAPPGFPHCTPETCNSEKPCTLTIHAEANAISWAARNGIAVKNSTLYCTLSPCAPCAKLILAAGISKILYLKEYRDIAPLSLLLSGGVKVSGYYPFRDDVELRAFYGSSGQ